MRRTLADKSKITASAKWQGLVVGAFTACWVTEVFSQDLSQLPPGLLDKVQAAEQACSNFEAGQFSLAFGAVLRVDLDGDIDQDWVLDEAGFNCSTAASLFCGTGGCVSHFLVDGQLHSLLNRGWDMARLGTLPVLLADLHGSQCDGINPTPCVVASVWDAEKNLWRSIGAVWE